RYGHAEGQVVEAAAFGNGGPAKFHIAFQVQLQRPAVDADAVVKTGAAQHIGFGELVLAVHTPGFANADLRRDVHDVRRLEPGNFLEKTGDAGDLLAAQNLG